MGRYLFVDARYFWKVLDNISREFFRGEKLLVDFRALAEPYIKAFYYDLESTEFSATRRVRAAPVPGAAVRG